MSNDVTMNRYANDWNTYSAQWAEHHGTRYAHLGDEWCDDGTAGRERERRLFDHSVRPWLAPNLRVLEIGCGGGKWTVQLAPQVRELVVFDVAESMIDRTRARCEATEVENVSFVLGNGRDLSPIPSGSIDLVFSYDVFVHIALEDTVAYLNEIARVLRDGGVAILHHAVNDTAAAWDRIESHNDWYRQRENTLGQYDYYGRDAIDRMYARAGLTPKTSYSEYCTTVITAEKSAGSLVPRLEQALRQAAVAASDAALGEACQALADVGRDGAARLASLSAELATTRPGSRRYDVIQRIRRVVRG